MAEEAFDFNSSNIQSAVYDSETGNLTITFSRTGESYDYAGVPTEIWQQFKWASSPGKFFSQFIRPRF